MWRALVAVGLVVGACRFDHGRRPIDAAPAIDSDGTSATPDTALPCAGAKVWAATFASDPTQLDDNGDGTMDWRMRDGSAFPGELDSGVWVASGSLAAPLDTAPKQDFATRTVATARLRATGMDVSSRGAILWLNVDYTATTFVPLWFEVRLDAAGQQQIATLHGKDMVQTETTILTFSDLSAGMITVELDIDPVRDVVTATVEGTTIAAVYVPIPRANNDDRFATLVAYGADSEFDDVRIAVCP